MDIVFQVWDAEQMAPAVIPGYGPLPAEMQGDPLGQFQANVSFVLERGGELVTTLPTDKPGVVVLMWKVPSQPVTSP